MGSAMVREPPYLTGLPHSLHQTARRKNTPHTPSTAEKAKIHTPNRNEEEPRLIISRATTSNLFRLITGHAFTGEWAATGRFLKNKFPQPFPEELEACPCGAKPQTVEHVLRTCLIFDETRRKLLTTHSRVRTSRPRTARKPCSSCRKCKLAPNHNGWSGSQGDLSSKYTHAARLISATALPRPTTP